MGMDAGQQATAPIDRALAGGVTPFRFPAACEAEYRRDTVREQRRPVSVGMLIGLALFDAFAVNDGLMLRESLAVFLVGRFLVATPIGLLCWAVVRRSEALYQPALWVYGVTLTGSLTAMLALGAGGSREHYLFGSLLVMVGVVAVLRPRFTYAVSSLLVQCACCEAAVLWTDIVPPEGRGAHALYALCTAVLSAFTAFAVESVDRRAFLLKLRAQVLGRHLGEMALLDPLTGLGNRRALDEASCRLWSDAAGASRRVSLILIDIDFFKTFNDSYGHAAGDLCLERVAGRVRALVGSGGATAVRFGGEEIAVFLPDAGPAEARARAEAIRGAILSEAIPHPAVAPGAVVTVSLGVASAVTGQCDLLDLVKRADVGLYAAKRNGRNQVWTAETAPLAA